MNSSDVRIVRLNPVTGNGSFTGGGGSYWDSAGVLQTAPPNTLRMSYDPSDLSKAPYAVVEPATTNYAQNNTMAGAVAGTPGTWPTGWSGATTVNGVSRSIVAVGVEDGIPYIDIGFTGTATGNAGFYPNIASAAAIAGQNWQIGAFTQLISGSRPSTLGLVISGRRSDGGAAEDGPATTLPEGGRLRDAFIVSDRTFTSADTVSALSFLSIGFNAGTIADCVVRIGLPQMCRDWVSKFPIKTTNGIVTRPADAVGPGAGLVYSNVAITEPLWVAGTYALGVRVRDSLNFVFESQAAGNTAPLTDKTKWLPLGMTNLWRAFDKTVNTQTSAPGLLVLAIKPGTVVNTLKLLNMEGSSVTVSQSESGYVRNRNLVRHEVDNWFDFYYEEPIRAGDAVFDDIPPYPNAMLAVAVHNGPLDAKIGACLPGKSIVIGKATSSFKAGVLSYSTSTTDTFGSITMVKRYNAPRMNFDVMVPAGSEDQVFRILREYTDVEIGIIVGDRFAMGIGYGFLGQWDVAKAGSGRTSPIEFKGLV